MAELLVLFEAQHRDAGLRGVFGKLCEIGLRLVTAQKTPELRPALDDPPFPEGCPVVLRVPQPSQVRVLDASLAEGEPETGLAEAWLATDRCQSHIIHDADLRVEQRGDERIEVTSLVPGGPEPRAHLGLS